jgi:signal transduction histidine kinase
MATTTFNSNSDRAAQADRINTRNQKSTRQAYLIVALLIIVALALIYVVRLQPNIGSTSDNGATLSNPGPSAPNVTTD